MTARTAFRTIPLLFTTLALAACGGGDDDNADSSDGDKLPVVGAEADAVKAAAFTVITDPAESCSLLTPNALSTFTGGVGGEKGIVKCEKQAADDKFPSEATIVVLRLEGTQASVGYSTSLATGAMHLVKSGEQWLADRITTLPAQ